MNISSFRKLCIEEGHLGMWVLGVGESFQDILSDAAFTVIK